MSCSGEEKQAVRGGGYEVEDGSVGEQVLHLGVEETGLEGVDIVAVAY